MREPFVMNIVSESFSKGLLQGRQESADALEARDKTIAELCEAIDALDRENVFSVHVGYDDAPGGGDFVYADAIRIDTDSYRRLKELRSKAKE
jgi:hypothetical protein